LSKIKIGLGLDRNPIQNKSLLVKILVGLDFLYKLLSLRFGANNN